MNNKIDIKKLEKIKESKHFNERKDFIIENYPLDESNYDVDDLIASGLDGKKVLEKKDQDGDMVGILTYEIDSDNDGVKYASIGIVLTREESRGEQVMEELFSELKDVCGKENCKYIVGIADTKDGENFVLKKGFYLETDSVNGRDYWKLDLDIE